MKELKELSVEVRSKEYEDTADAFYEAGNYLEAIEEYRKSIELDSSYAENYYKVGKCYYKLENYKEAIIAYTSAINLCPLEEEYYYSRALCYLEMRKYNLVIEDINEATEVSREVEVKYYIIKAEAYFKLNKYDEAKKYYDIAVYNEYTNEQGVWFYPSLAKKVGDNESLVLMLIHEYFSYENRLEDLEELCVSYLPSLTSISIKKAIGKLIKLGLLVRYRDSVEEIKQENKKYLVINYDLLEEMIFPNKLNYGRC